MPNASQTTRWEFGAAVIDLRARTLAVDGQKVRVEPKVFDLIAYLVANHGRAIGRDELIAAVWGASDVNDAVLAQVMRKARKAVGDSGDGQTHIQTIVRFGYRWVAATRPAELPEETPRAVETPAAGAPAPAMAEFVQPVPSPQRSRRPLVWLGAVLLLLTAVAGGLWLRSARHAPAQPALLAVLPTYIASDDPSQQWASAGVMALLRDRLGQHAGLTTNGDADLQRLVRSATPGKAQRELAHEWTGARWVLETTVLQTQPEWRIRYALWEGDRALVQGSVAATELAAATKQLSDAVLGALGQAPLAAPVAGDQDERYARAAAQVLAGDLEGGRQALLTLAPDEASPGRVQVLLAEVERRLGQADQARQRLNALAPDLTTAEPTPVQLDALRVLGRLEIQQRHLDAAEAAFNRLLQAAGNTGADSWRADAWSGLAFVAQRRKDIDKATEFYGRARAIRHSLGDRFGLAKQDANEGVFALEQGRALVALERLRRANEAFDQLGLQQETAMTLFDMAQASTELGRLAEQRAMHASALAVYGVLNDDYGKLRTQARQMYAAYLSGEFRSGLSTVDGLLLDARRLGYATVEAEIHMYQGLLLGGQLRWQESQTALELARTVYAQAQAKDGEREAVRALAVVLARQGKAEEALALLGVQDNRLQEANAQASDLLARGDVLNASGRAPEAFEAWSQAHDFASAHGIDYVRIAAAIAMGNQLVDRRELDKAEPLIGELTRDGAETYDAERLRARYLAATNPAAAAAAWQRVAALRGERAAEPVASSDALR